MRKFARLVILVPLALVIAVFAIANRHLVTVTLDPLGRVDQSSALVFSVPLFALIFIFLIVGALIGGIAAWFGQGKWRRLARAAQAESRALRSDNERLKHDIADPNVPNTPARLPKAAAPIANDMTGAHWG